MQHLLERHLAQRAPPALDRRQLGRRHALADVALQRPDRIEVAAHGGMLEFRRLGEQVVELLAVLDDDVLVRHSGLPRVPVAGAARRYHREGISVAVAGR
jgi:hypothetical protein